LKSRFGRIGPFSFPSDEWGFFVPSTKKPSADWGRNPQRAETKAEPSHSMPIYLTPPILAIRGDFPFQLIPIDSTAFVAVFGGRRWE
jgi:hypothetical protein